MTNDMITHGILTAKAMLGGKSGIIFAIGATAPLLAIASDGNIGEGTGVAIGFVGGLLVAVAGGSWYFRGMVDEQKDLKKRVEKVENIIHTGKNLERY